MRKKQLKRQHIFDKKRLVLVGKELTTFATIELNRQLSKKRSSLENFNFDKVKVDIYDPFTCVSLGNDSYPIQLSGYAKRMPDDIPNDKIGIQNAVKRLVQRIKWMQYHNIK